MRPTCCIPSQAKPAEESISELVLGALGKRSKDILPGVAAPLLSTLSSSSQKASTVVVVYVGKQVKLSCCLTDCLLGPGFFD
jgi:hypothetical protein